MAMRHYTTFLFCLIEYSTFDVTPATSAQD